MRSLYVHVKVYVQFRGVHGMLGGLVRIFVRAAMYTCVNLRIYR